MTCACGCDGADAGTSAGDASDLRPAANPAGLTDVAYRVADFAGFRRALLTPLPGEEQLTGWSPGPEDLGLQVLEWWAYLGDILTFYNERIANNSYLRTASAQPVPGQNVAALARQLGYLTRPGTSATGEIAVIRGAGSPGEHLAIPGGLQVSSTPAPGVPAQLFEVDKPASGHDAYSFKGPSDGFIGLTPDEALFGLAPGGAGDAATDTAQSVLLAGHAAVTAGEPLLLVERDWHASDEHWAVVTAGSAVTETDPNGAANTRVSLTSAAWHDLTSSAPTASQYRLQRATATALLWTMSAPRKGGGGGPPADTEAQTAGDEPQTVTVRLATLVRGVAPGDNVLFTGSSGQSLQAVQVLAQVTGYAEEVTQVKAEQPNGKDASATRPPPPPAFVPHTTLTLAVTPTDAPVLQAAVAGTNTSSIAMQYGFRDVGTLIPTPAATLERLPATVTSPPGLVTARGSAVVLEDARGVGLKVTADPAPDSSVRLTGLAALHPPLRAPIRLLADLVPVSQGTTVRDEVLGDGDPTVAGQAFVLQHSPLIYLPSAQPGGFPKSTLTVTVDMVVWQPVTAFRGQAPDATVYVASQLADGTTQVRFGDGIDGARLPLGVGNVTATYRYGPATAPPPPGRLSTVLQPQPNLASVRSPLPLTPGTKAERADETFAAAPATALLLSRAGSAQAAPAVISLTDCENLAATVIGVTRVRARWTWDPDRRCPAITVYVGASVSGTDAAVAAVRGLLAGVTTRVPLIVALARPVDLSIGCELLCPPGTSQAAIKAAAVSALAGLFSAERMGIGQRLHRSQVEAALAVPGVSAVLGLRIRRHRRAEAIQGSQAAERYESVFDPGPGGYFNLPGTELSIGVVTR